MLLDHGDLLPFKLRAEDVGLTPQPLEAIRGGNAEENAVILRELLLVNKVHTLTPLY